VKLTCRSFIQRLCLSVILYGGLIVAAQATADGPDYWKIINVASDDALNLREHPNWKSRKVAEIPYNVTCLANLECVGGLSLQEIINLSEAEKKKILKQRPKWCKVKFNSITGWVSAKFLAEGQELKCNKE